ncbi:MAG: hypothetical protein ACHQEB_05815 [Chitinophagales bacterium]
MKDIAKIGRIFYGIAIAGFGFLTIYYNDFPYMLLPPHHFWITSHVMLAYIFGTMFILAGASIVFEIKTRPISLLLGIDLLLIFCFYFIPYQFMTKSNYLHFGEWENAAKGLALSGGAFVIADCFSGKNENSFFRFLRKLISFGAIFFSITIISFGINHFLYAKDVADYVPSWVPLHLFWTYLAGTALIGSGVAIFLKIKPELIATLLGTMIFIWFIILHIPRVIASPLADIGSEVASAFLALAYSGIAFVIAGVNEKRSLL